jgi:hypothetical protein
MEAAAKLSESGAYLLSSVRDSIWYTDEKSFFENPELLMSENKLYAAAPVGSGAFTALAASVAKPRSFCIKATPKPPVYPREDGTPCAFA